MNTQVAYAIWWCDINLFFYQLPHNYHFVILSLTFIGGKKDNTADLFFWKCAIKALKNGNLSEDRVNGTLIFTHFPVWRISYRMIITLYQRSIINRVLSPSQIHKLHFLESHYSEQPRQHVINYHLLIRLAVGIFITLNVINRGRNLKNLLNWK